MMNPRKPRLSFAWIAAISLFLVGLGITAILTTMSVFATATIEFAGPMHDRMLEEQNGGVPVAVVRRRTAVMQALQSPQAVEWAGEYYEGDGLGENVVMAIAPDAGVAATWLGCVGVYGSNEGDIDDLGGGRLAFRFSRRNGNDAGILIGTFPSSVTLVRWGARRYLLADDEMIKFVNAIHQGSEPRKEGHGSFLLARDDEKLPASGLPTLPAEYLAYLRSTPLDVRLTSVEQVGNVGRAEYPGCKYRVHFNAPIDEQLPIGLEFSVKSQEYVSEDFTVVASSAGEVSAEATFFDDCLTVEERPTTDWVLTSGAYPAKTLR